MTFVLSPNFAFNVARVLLCHVKEIFGRLYEVLIEIWVWKTDPCHLRSETTFHTLTLAT